MVLFHHRSLSFGRFTMVVIIKFCPLIMRYFWLLKVAQSQRVYRLWSHCQQKVQNYFPEQKISMSCLLKRAGNSNLLLSIFFGNGTKVKITSEIKPPIDHRKSDSNHKYLPWIKGQINSKTNFLVLIWTPQFFFWFPLKRLDQKK